MYFPSLAADWGGSNTLVTDGGGLYFIVQQSASYQNPPVPFPWLGTTMAKGGET